MSAYYTYVSNVPMRAILTGIFALYQGIRIGRAELKAKKMKGGPRAWPR